MRSTARAQIHGDASGVQYVQKIAAILNCFRQCSGNLGVSEISRTTGIHKSTVSRLLAALAGEELVTYELPSRRYRLGPGVISLAAAAEPELFLPAFIRPYLVRLNAETGETAGFERLDAFESVSVDAVSGPRLLRAAVWSGRRAPLHASAAGKCLLAFSPAQLLETYVATQDMAPQTANTITDVAELRREIALVRERGYSCNREELEEGVGAVAAPVCDHAGWRIGAINLSWPVSRVQAAEREHITTLLLGAARQATAVFGRPPAALQALTEAP